MNGKLFSKIINSLDPPIVESNLNVKWVMRIRIFNDDRFSKNSVLLIEDFPLDFLLLSTSHTWTLCRNRRKSPRSHCRLL